MEQEKSEPVVDSKNEPDIQPVRPDEAAAKPPTEAAPR